MNSNTVDKMKLQVNISCEAVARIDAIARSMGMSRSAVCCYWIGQGLMQHELAAKAAADLVARAAEKAAYIADESSDALLRADAKRKL